MQSPQGLKFFVKQDRDKIEMVVKHTKSVRELRKINRQRLKQLNQVLAAQKNDSPWVYPYDFQSYDDK